MNPSLMARCKELIKNPETELEAKVVLKIGPVKVRFGGAVNLETSGAPDPLSLTGQSSGGGACNAKGGAYATLVETDGKPS